MAVYSGILSDSGWSLAVIGPIVPERFFRVWVRVWVKTGKRGRKEWSLTHYDRFGGSVF